MKVASVVQTREIAYTTAWETVETAARADSCIEKTVLPIREATSEAYVRWTLLVEQESHCVKSLVDLVGAQLKLDLGYGGHVNDRAPLVDLGRE